MSNEGEKLHHENEVIKDYMKKPRYQSCFDT